MHGRLQESRDKRLEIKNVCERSLLCSQRLHLFDNNTVKHFFKCNLFLWWKRNLSHYYLMMKTVVLLNIFVETVTLRILKKKWEIEIFCNFFNGFKAYRDSSPKN